MTTSAFFLLGAALAGAAPVTDARCLDALSPADSRSVVRERVRSVEAANGHERAELNAASSDNELWDAGQNSNELARNGHDKTESRCREI